VELVDKDDFDHLMEQWVDRETRSAPDLRPSPEMYKLVESTSGTKGIRPLRTGWKPIAIASASLVALVILSLLVTRPPIFFDRQSELAVAYLDVQSGPDTDKGVIILGPQSPEKGGRTGPGEKQLFDQIVLQTYLPGAMAIESYDLRYPLQAQPVLTTDHLHRLQIESKSEQYLYIYHINPLGEPGQLFPNPVYCPTGNPVPGGEQLTIPDEPDWFSMMDGVGEHSIVLVASPHAITQLDDLFMAFLQSKQGLERESALTAFSDYLEILLTQPGGEIQAWVYPFNLH
jgi:hypothetical protein